ncbi:MAG TPA: septum formation initiator family protein [Gemmatimonadales bacterium]
MLVLAGFAALGGTYGTGDLLSLKNQLKDEQERISQLRHDLDSLMREAHALKTDPATQERFARELYGMIRPGELLYQVVPADTTH